jgi:hypothetical protein
MRTKIISAVAIVVATFLLVANPVVADAAGKITGKQIKNNSVGSKDIKDNDLKGADVKDGSIAGTDVTDGSLTGADLADGSLTGADVADGPLTGADIPLRVSSASRTADLTGVTAATDLLTTAITAPAKGFLVIEGSVEAHNLAGELTTPTCDLLVDAAAIPSSFRFLGHGTNNVDEDCDTQATVAVNPGNHSVVLRVDPQTGNDHFQMGDLTVLFVPFGATGSAPARPTELDRPGAAVPHRH